LCQRYEGIVVQNLYIKHQSDRIYKVFEGHKIPVIALKGITLAERYFGHFAARETSDIDLFVQVEHVSAAVKCLQELGFSEPKRYNPLHFHCVLSKQIEGQTVPLNVELHWSLVQEHTATSHPEVFWEDCTPKVSYSYIKEFSAQHAFYSICLHGANHKMDSLKYYLDIVHMIHHVGKEISFRELFEQAKRDGTLHRIRAVLLSTYRKFPYLHERQPLPHNRVWALLPDSLIFRFPLLLVDGWRNRLVVVKEWFWPPRDVALWHMQDDEGVNQSNVYFHFQRRRLMNVFNRK